MGVKYSCGGSSTGVLSNGEVTLYHTTSGDAAEKILAGQKMYRGSSGAFGGGIYFAETIEDSKRKAHYNGVTLKASVYIGRSLTLTKPNSSMTYTHLTRLGYHSVRGTCFNGDEYVVYNYSQVRKIKVVENSVMKYERCLEPKCARYKKKHSGGCGTLCSNRRCKMFGKLHYPKCKTKFNTIIL